jgi:hypothetical protein
MPCRSLAVVRQSECLKVIRGRQIEAYLLVSSLAREAISQHWAWAMLLLGRTLMLRHLCVSLSSHSFRPVERIGSRAARCCSYTHYFVPCCPFLSWCQQSNIIVSFYAHSLKLLTSTCRAAPQSTLFSSVPDLFCLRYNIYHALYTSTILIACCSHPLVQSCPSPLPPLIRT